MKTRLPRIIATREILHPAAPYSGPRITSVQTIETWDGIFEVDFWTNEKGHVCKFGDPRKLPITPATPNYETTEISFLCR